MTPKREDLVAAAATLRRSGDVRCIAVAQWMTQALNDDYAVFVKQFEETVKATKLEMIRRRMVGIVARIQQGSLRWRRYRAD